MLTPEECRVFDVEEAGDLAVVLCHFNPQGFDNPERNLAHTLQWLERERLPTFAVELACGSGRACGAALPAHPRILHLTAPTVFFRKENLWNIAARRLPDRYRYVLCLDADIVLHGRGWKEALLAELESHRLVHPFSDALWLDSTERVFRRKTSAVTAFLTGLDNPESGRTHHVGFGVALWRSFWSETAGLYNGPLGEGASGLMAAAMNRAAALDSYFGGISPEFLDHYRRWAKQVSSWTNGNLSYIDAEARHFWHGHSAKRKYVWHNPIGNAQYMDRQMWFAGFDPARDMTSDSQGLIDWTPAALATKPAIVSGIERYFAGRDEDEWYDSSV